MRMIRTFLLSFIFCCLLAGLVPAYGADPVGEDWIPVSSTEELAAIKNNLSGNYYLTQDLVFTQEDFSAEGAFYHKGAGWVPIGRGYIAVKIDGEDAFDENCARYGVLYDKVNQNYYAANQYDRNVSTYYYRECFTGKLDGRGHCIRGLQMDAVSGSHLGLFGLTKGCFYNLGLEDCRISAAIPNENAWCGALCGEAVDVENCYVTGEINLTLKDSYNVLHKVGGLAGYLKQASECYNMADISVTGAAYVGGLVGMTDSSATYKIKNCFNAGAVSGDHAGGLIGLSQGAQVECCYNVGPSDYGICSSALAIAHFHNNLYYQAKYCPFNNDIGTGKSRSELMVESAYAGFDFEQVWTMGPEGYPFPVLRNTKTVSQESSGVNPCKKGHQYTYEFHWSEDKASCVLFAHCGRDSEHDYTEKCTIKRSTVQAATCSKEGSRLLTATASGIDFADYEYQTIPKASHQAGGSKQYDSTNHWYNCIYGCGKKLQVTAHKFTYRKTASTASTCGKLKEGCSACNYTKTYKLPCPTVIRSLDKGRKYFAVRWKRCSYATGYQIRYSSYSSMKNSKTITVSGIGTLSKKVSGLNANKKYYVQVRTYRTVKGKKYLSTWSAKKSVITK